MKMNSFDISGKIDHLTVEILGVFSNVAESMKIPFFVVGATARDVILEYVYEIPPRRATVDLDLGVFLEDWDQYHRLTHELVDKWQFTEGRVLHRFSYKGKFPIDIIPFGGICEQYGTISWPPDHETIMSTLGFQESYERAILVRLRSQPLLEIKFASPCGLAAMKIISWNDRKAERVRDALDLKLIIDKYIDAGNLDRVLDGEEMDLLETDDFEYVGARLLGRDLAKLLNQQTKDRILEILERETGEQERYRLVEAMMGSGGFLRNNYEENLRLLVALKGGLQER